MDDYKCTICGHVYYPEKGEPDYGTPAGTDFSALPATWKCPICMASRDQFEKI